MTSRQRRLSCRASRFATAADEFANVFPHLGWESPEDQLASFGYDPIGLGVPSAARPLTMSSDRRLSQKENHAEKEA